MGLEGEGSGGEGEGSGVKGGGKLGLGTPLSTPSQSVFAISRRFYFHMRSFPKIKPSRKFPHLQNSAEACSNCRE